MVDFYDLLNELEQTPSTLDKEQLLIKIIRSVPKAEAFFRFTFNDIKYGIQEQTFKNAFPEYNNQCEHISYWLGTEDGSMAGLEVKNVDSLIEFGNIITRYSGNDQQLILRGYFDTLSSKRREWFCRAILKDLRCGVQVKTINRVFKQLGLQEIGKFSLQLCDKIDLYDEDAVKKKITFPCSMETKYDGIRIQATIYTELIHRDENSLYESTEVILTSRRGTDRTNDYPEIVNQLKEIFKGENIILDGEVIAGSFQGLTRKDDITIRKYVVFDLLVDEKLPYISRYDNLINLFNEKGITDFNINKNIKYNNNIITVAEHYSCNNLKEAQEFYEALNERGEEGIIIKLDNRLYERGSRKHMFKCKKVYSADLLCYGFKYGEGKRSNKVATLCLIDKSKTIIVDVGSGIDDETCEMLTKDVYPDYTGAGFIGNIVEINYNEITETGSLRFPRFIRFREDKCEPDDLSQTEVRQGDKSKSEGVSNDLD